MHFSSGINRPPYDESNLRSLCVSCHEKIHRRKKKDG